MSDSNVVELVDDRDDRIEYSGEWILGGGNEEYGGTTHGIYVGGSQVMFTFKGSSIWVYGTLSDNRSGTPLTDAPISTYSLDGSSPQTFSPPLPNGVYHRQLFYQSSNLDDKQHTLIVTSTVSGAAFWLDYFQITASTSSSSANNDRVSQTPSITCQVGGTPSSTQGGTQTSVNSSVTSTTNTVSVGAIAGSVVGGVVLLLLACLLLLLYRRKMRSRKAPSGFGIQPQYTNGINPFLTPYPFAQETRENQNTRFLGDVSPFTNHQSSRPTASRSGGLREKAAINLAGGPIVS